MTAFPHLVVTSFLLLVSLTTCFAAGPVEVGCFLDNVNSPVFIVSPGGYNPDAMNPSACAQACQNAEAAYAGIQQGSFCFCSQVTSGMTPSPSASCSSSCSDNSTSSQCGGINGYTSVYEAMTAPELSGLSLVASANSVAVHTPVTFSFGVVEGTDVYYKMEYGDGAARSIANASGIATHTYQAPGTYFATAYASDSFNPQNILSVSVPVVVTQSLMAPVMVDCPALANPGDLTTCNVSMLYGPATQLTFDSGDGTGALTDLNVPATQFEFLGHPVPQAEVGDMQNATIANIIVLISSVMDGPGYLVAVDAYIVKPGTVEFLVLTPACSTAGTTFCYSTGKCESTCSAPPDQVACAAPATFYPSSQSCGSGGGATKTFQFDTFTESFSYSAVVSSAGYLYQSLPVPAQLRPGDVLGLRAGPGAAVAYRNASSAGEADQSASTVGGPRAATAVAHYARAIVSRPATLTLPHMFNNTGNFTVRAVAGSVVNSTVVVVTAGIGAVNVTVDQPYMSVGQTFNVTCIVYNGSDYTMLWDYGDGSTNTTSVIGSVVIGTYAEPHTYTNEGNYVITVTASNIVDTLNDTAAVVILFPVTPGWSLTSNSPQLFPGDINFQLMFQSGRLPSNATAAITWGDSSSTQVENIPPGSSRLTSMSLVHTYASGGDYSVSIFVSNLVSNTTVTTQVTLYERIQGLSVSISYTCDSTGTTPKPGGGAAGNVVLPNSVVTLNVVKLRGTISGYIMYTAEGVWVMNSTTSPLSYSVTQTGKYNLTIYAWNPAQGLCDPANVTIVVELPPEIPQVALEIDDFYLTTGPNQSKPFELVLGGLSTDVCLMITYNDTKEPTPDAYGNENYCLMNFSDWQYNFRGPLQTTVINVTHLFKASGVFLIDVVAFSNSTVARTSLVFSVTDFPCPRPNLTLDNARLAVTEATIFQRASAIKLQTHGVINCSTNVNSSKQWTLSLVDSEFGLNRSNVDLSSVDSSTKSVLLLPSLFLPYGYYRATYTLSIYVQGVPKSTPPWSRSLYTYFRVAPSPLQASFIYGSMSRVIRGRRQMMYLSTSNFSVDPDFPSDRTFNVTWFCRRVAPNNESYPMVGANYDTSRQIPVPLLSDAKPTTDGGGCFGTGPGELDYRGSTWSFNLSLFYSFNMEFEVMAIISKGDRNASTSVLISVTDTNPPSLSIKCQENDICIPLPNGLQINPRTRLGVHGQCDQECDGAHLYSWQVLKEATDEEYTEAQDYMNGGLTTDMAINAGFFGNNSGPGVFHLQFTAESSDGTLGQSTLFLYINRPPSDGSCTLSPSHGRALLDNFQVSCINWVDPEQQPSITYKFYVSINGSSSFSILYYGSESTIELILPYGQLDLRADIADYYGSYITVEIATLSSELPSRADFVAFTNSSFISNMVGGGDQTQICQVFLAISSIEASGFLNPSFNPNDTSAIKQNDVSESDRMVTYLEGLSTVTAGSLNDIQMITSVLSGVTKDSSDIDRRSKKLTTNQLSALGKVLSGITLHSPQDVTNLVGDAMTVMGALVNSIKSTVVDKRIVAADKANVFDINYDAGIGDDTSFEMPDSEDEMQNGGIISETSGNAIDQVRAMNKFLCDVSHKVFSQLVPGEPPIRVDTENGAAAIFGKMQGEDVANLTYDLGDASFRLPSVCVLLGLDDDCRANETSLGVQGVAWPSILQSFGKSVDRLSNNTKTVQIDLFDSNNRPLHLTNLSQPVDIFIPRTRDNDSSPIPAAETFNTTMRWNEVMLYHQFNVSKPSSSVNVEISPADMTAPILVFLRYGSKPTVTKYDHVTRLVDVRRKNDTSDTYDLFYSSATIWNRTGIFYLGIAEVNVSAPGGGYAVGVNVSYTYEEMTQNLSTVYSIRIYTSGCYFYNEYRAKWMGDGCWVANADYLMTHCQCNHLTTFGSGFFVMPNTVDFNYVFAHASFNDNLTIYLTLIITFAVFILMLIWARWKDKKDLTKLGASPLPDNNPSDTYLYEVIVQTGSRKNAGTDSKVAFILSGEDEETEVRVLADTNRKILQKSDVNVFVMAVPRSLGPLSYMRIWHDNSGKGMGASWYLNVVSVQDIQTGEKSAFIADCWLAVEEGDGSLDRIVPVAGKEQLTAFGHLLSSNAKRHMADGHLWFSVFLRPPRSRFTRVQRVACCVAFLYLSMLVNAMWYGKTDNNTSTSAFRIGPFSVSTEQIAVGIISNLIVFPPSFLIVLFFRKARPYKLRPSRIDEALKRQRENKMKKAAAEEKKKSESKTHLVSNDELSKQKDKAAAPPSAAPWRSKKFSLPFIFRYIAWALVFVCIGGACFLLWAYGLQFGNDKTKKWVTSLVLSFFASVLITEPLKLFLIAMLMSAICKVNDDDEDDSDQDELDPALGPDEEYLHMGGTVNRPKRPDPLDHEALEKARTQRLKEIKMWEILKEIFGYLVFLWVLVMVSDGNRDPNAFYFQNTLTKAFIQQGKIFDYTKVKTTPAFYDWSRNILIPRLRAQRLYNDFPPFGYKGFLNDQVNRLMGFAIIRQVRIERNKCSAPRVVANVTKCSGGFTDIFDEDETSYTVGWNGTVDPNIQPPMNEERSFLREAYIYRSASSLEGYPLVGQLDVYGGGGYVVELKGNTDYLIDLMDQLQANNWIDRFTRAVLVEFSVYNTQVNLFGVASIMAEFVPGGGIFPNYRFDGIRLLEYHQGFGLFVLLSEVAFVLLTVYFTVREIIEMCREKKKYLKSHWNLLEVVMLVLSYAAIVVFALRMVETNSAMDKFNSTVGNKYVNIQRAYMLDQTLVAIVAFVVFAGTLKFIKLLRFNRRIGILSTTLSHAYEHLSVFGLCFLMVFLTFSQLFYLLLSTTTADFGSFMQTVEYTFSMMLNQFDYDEISMGCPVLGPLAFFVFSLMTSIVLVNLFFTIVISAFEDVARDIFKQPNDYEIVDFVLGRFKSFVGFGPGGYLAMTPPPPPPRQLSKPDSEQREIAEANPQVAQLKTKVQHLLEYVNEEFLDGKADLSGKAQLRHRRLSKPKNVFLDNLQ